MRSGKGCLDEVPGSYVSPFGKDVKLFGETDVQLRKSAPKVLEPKFEEMEAIFSGLSKNVDSILGSAAACLLLLSR